MIHEVPSNPGPSVISVNNDMQLEMISNIQNDFDTCYKIGVPGKHNVC